LKSTSTAAAAAAAAAMMYKTSCKIKDGKGCKDNLVCCEFYWVSRHSTDASHDEAAHWQQNMRGLWLNLANRHVQPILMM
jgi:hypothetical protein